MTYKIEKDFKWFHRKNDTTETQETNPNRSYSTANSTILPDVKIMER